MGKMIGEGEGALVCAPILGKDRDEVLAELDFVMQKQPDVIEWRADFFSAIAQTDEVLALAHDIRGIAADTTLIFTIRSAREGGQPIPLTQRQSVELAAEICRKTGIEYVDCELGNAREDLELLREAASAGGTKVIGSFHNFERTPDATFLLDKLLEAERLGLDVAKVAVMPNGLEDVLTLLAVTLEAKKSCKVPVITMSMGGYGALTRMVGGVFGSSLTFAVAKSSSAPGQVPIEDLRTVLEIVERALKQG